MALSLFQILPTYELAGLSRRASGLSYLEASADSLSPLQFVINFILPNCFGYYGNHTYWGVSFPSEMSSYTGILPVVLAIYTFLKSKEKHFVSIFWFIALMALIFAMGKYTPVYELFFKLGFSNFRSPARFIYIFIFSIAILAGFGMNSLLSNQFVKNNPAKSRQRLFAINSSSRRVFILLFIVAASAVLYYLINYPLGSFNKIRLHCGL